jgi:uncharacterized membrane protein (UPF0127 family)
MRYSLLAVPVVFFLLFGCLAPALKTTTVTINDTKITAWIADTENARETGLMGMQNINENEGMLFVYERPGAYAFWMKNTLMPLDIIFVSSDMKIISIQNMEPCTMEPCKIYPPPSNIMYAIEVKGGFAERHNVTVGQTVKID